MGAQNTVIQKNVTHIHNIEVSLASQLYKVVKVKQIEADVRLDESDKKIPNKFIETIKIKIFFRKLEE